MKLLALLVVLSSLALLCPPADARKLESWTYERLFKEADIVVIAYPTGSADNGDRLETDWDVPFLGIDTAFEIEQALKGKPGTALTLLHFRTERPLQNGPLFVSFPTEDRQLAITERGPADGGPRRLAPVRREVSLGRASYLLFLKRRDDGRYEAVSGQVDPALSVRTLRQPGHDF